MLKKGIWITWEIQRRNKGLSSALQWPFYEIVHNEPRIMRYMKSFIETVGIILKEKPSLVAAQNPSIVLAFLVVALKYVFRYITIIDSHNRGIYPLEGRVKVLMTLSKWLQRRADLTLVTNETLKSVVESNKGQAFVLPDRIPSVPPTKPFPLDGRYNIAYISTFSEDEPYEEVIKAANSIPEDVYIYFTGKYEGKLNLGSLPKNIKLLGFIPDAEYWSLLDSVDTIIDLTLREGCLVCGAYEGIALSKPLILSRTQAIMSYFNRGCIYAEPRSGSIASAIQVTIEKRYKLKSEIKMLKESLKNNWNTTFKDLQQKIDSL